MKKKKNLPFGENFTFSFFLLLNSTLAGSELLWGSGKVSTEWYLAVKRRLACTFKDFLVSGSSGGEFLFFFKKKSIDFWFASFLFFQQNHLLTSSCWSECTSEKRIFWWFWQYQKNLDWSLFPAATGLIRKPKKPFLIRFSISDTVLFVIRKRPFFSSLHK